MKKRSFGLVLFGVYIACLAYALFLSRAYRLHSAIQNWVPLPQYWHGATNLVPLRTIRGYLYVITRSGTLDIRSAPVRNLAGNILLFIPMGWFLPALFPQMRRFLKMLAVSAVAIVIIEVMQLLTRTGSCDVDDLILNLIGCAAGYLLWSGKNISRATWKN